MNRKSVYAALAHFLSIALLALAIWPLDYPLGVRIGMFAALVVVSALWEAAIRLALRDARDYVARIVENEAAKARLRGRPDDTAPLGRFALEHPPLTQPDRFGAELRTGRHCLTNDETTQQLLTHDGLYGAYAASEMPDTDVAEADPRKLYPEYFAQGAAARLTVDPDQLADADRRALREQAEERRIQAENAADYPAFFSGYIAGFGQHPYLTHGEHEGGE